MHSHQSFIFKQLVEYLDDVQTAEQAEQLISHCKEDS